MMHGEGKYTWPDGRWYQGSYSEDKKQGQGTYSWPDGKRYTGGWENGVQHGEGEFTNTKLQRRSGKWVEGKRVAWIGKVKTENETPAKQEDGEEQSNNQQ